MVTARDRKRLRFRRRERLFWIWFYRLWPGCLKTLAVFKTDTSVRGQRKGFRLYWTWKSRRSSGGRPTISPQIRMVMIARIARSRLQWSRSAHFAFAGYAYPADCPCRPRLRAGHIQRGRDDSQRYHLAICSCHHDFLDCTHRGISLMVKAHSTASGSASVTLRGLPFTILWPLPRSTLIGQEKN